MSLSLGLLSPLLRFLAWLLAAMAPPAAKKKNCPLKEEQQADGMPLLDLPELALDCILSKLPPEDLREMSGVCRELRQRCRSDHLWARHVDDKYGAVVGSAARQRWASSSSEFVTSERTRRRRRRWLRALSCVWPSSAACRRRQPPPLDGSLMSLFLSLQSGRFWFPAQVYNRENGHIGFILSCYDAELSYDAETDTFRARYPPHGRRAAVVEEGVEWHRVRKLPVETPPHGVHPSESLAGARPGDHVEIQWRRSKEFPYGWWYGVVGHLESCNAVDDERFCRCDLSETVVLQFKQYMPGSRWRKTEISRHGHRESGNENDGFYGGVRRLRSDAEITPWRRLWPTDVLQ